MKTEEEEKLYLEYLDSYNSLTEEELEENEKNNNHEITDFESTDEFKEYEKTLLKRRTINDVKQTNRVRKGL